VRVAGTDRGAPASTMATSTMANTVTINVMEREPMPGRTGVCTLVALFPIVVKDMEFTPGPMVPDMKVISRTDNTMDREPTRYAEVHDDVLSYSWISSCLFLTPLPFFDLAPVCGWLSICWNLEARSLPWIRVSTVLLA
jgi:hypothetical protein